MSRQRGRPRVRRPQVRRQARELRDEIPAPADVVARSGGRIGTVRRFVIWLISGFTRSRANDLAAAIAYYALLSIVPIVLGLFSILGLVLRTDAGYEQATEWISWLVPDELAGDSLAALPHLRDQSAAYGLLSLIGFLWVGSTFFAALGRAMNQVYGVPDRAPVQQRVRAFLTVVALAALFTIAVVAAVAPTVLLGIDEDSMPSALEQWPLFVGIYQLLSYVTAVAMAILLFGAIFRIAPAARQRVVDIVPGAIVSGCAFVLLAQVFPVYLQLVQGWNLVSGTAGLLSLVLIWFYILGHLFLFGAYINATWQRFHRADR